MGTGSSRRDRQGGSAPLERERGEADGSHPAAEVGVTVTVQLSGHCKQHLRSLSSGIYEKPTVALPISLSLASASAEPDSS